MNTRLEKLFEIYQFSDKERYEFMQIYTLLPAHKKVTALENFDRIYENMQMLREDLRQQHEVLFGSTLDRIEKKVARLQQKNILTKTKNEIEYLKSIL